MAMHGKFEYTPSLGGSHNSHNYALEVFTTVKANLIEDLGQGIGSFEATELIVRKKPGNNAHYYHGYFGVQYRGRNEDDTLLYSIWDNKKNTGSYKSDKKAIPFHENCYRNCNDCSHKNSTGTQCRFVFPKKLDEGDELKFTIERGPVETKFQEEFSRNFTGHIWTVSLSYSDGPNKETFMSDQFNLEKDDEFILGQILFSEKRAKSR